MAIPGVVYVVVHRVQTGASGSSLRIGRPSSFPPASSEERKHPFGAPAAAPAGTGGYRFQRTQPGSASPVTWDPCRPIHYVVSGNVPAGQETVVSSVVAEVSRLTGLQFVYDGRTTELAGSGQRQPYQPSRYGRRWAPVLVSWTDPARVPKLFGSVIGLGGGAAVSLNGSPQTYVSGIVYLDAPQFRADAAKSGTQQRAILRATVLHEFGHLLGLAHVSDPAAIMYPEAHLSVTDYSPGDLRGLHALATGHCASNL